VKGISRSTRPSHTDRRFSALCGLNSYLSSRCLIGRDYTLLKKGVKQDNPNIIGLAFFDDWSRLSAQNEMEKYVNPNAKLPELRI
jgi:hypothetical protein